MSDQPQVIHLKDYQVPDFQVDHVYLHIDLFEDRAIVRSVLHMHRHSQAQNQQAPLVLNGEEMILQKIILDGIELEKNQYEISSSTLTVLAVPKKFILETEVAIKPALNKALSGLYQSRDNFCTQCEPHGFRRITYFLDRPDIMTRFTTSISADRKKYPYLLSNGNLVEEKILGDRHYVRWEDPSLKPSYLFALVAGDFDVLSDTFVTMSGREVKLQLFLEKGFADQGAFSIEALKHAMRWDEKTWGREYDLDIYMIVAVSDFNMGAMENKGLNIFNTKYILAKPETATDQDYVNIEVVIGHEYFHNWSGNRVTCRDWFQITLKEGLTVFRDQSFCLDMTSPAVARIPEVMVMRNQQFVEDASPMAHPIRPESYIEVNNFYTLTVYRKGAEVIRMVQTLLTPKVFRQGLDLYFEKFDGNAVTTDDFIAVMEEASGRDLKQFKRWYSQVGTPKIDVTSHYNPENKTFSLTFKQFEQAPLHIPVAVGLIGPACHDVPTRLENEHESHIGTRILELTKHEQTFTFSQVDEKPVPSLFRNFSAPVEYNYDYSDESLAWLVLCDSDAYSRWDASQSLYSRVLLKLTSAVTELKGVALDSLMLDTVKNLLDPIRGDKNLLSSLLVLPSESFLLAKMFDPDVEAIHQVREWVKTQMGTQLYPYFEKTYVACSDQRPYEYNVEEMGRRSLRNASLHYLAASKNSAAIDLAVRQFSTADNMTDQLGALMALNDLDCPERLELLDQFYEKWKHEPLVVNKWLSLHASSTLANTQETVQLLMDHPGFSIHNPNNVYSLLCVFGANQSCFHEKSGKAYEFIADQVLAIDKNNPQVAARVLRALTYWQRVDKNRASRMRFALDRIAKTAGISKDIYEISTKSK